MCCVAMERRLRHPLLDQNRVGPEPLGCKRAQRRNGNAVVCRDVPLALEDVQRAQLSLRQPHGATSSSSPVELLVAFIDSGKAAWRIATASACWASRHASHRLTLSQSGPA